MNTKHPLYKKSSKHPIYKIWSNMKSRCYNRNSRAYRNYGDRGITVCDRWKNSFKDFLEDIEERPSNKYSIERINNDQGYNPSNCKWATQLEQANNRRNNIYIEAFGKRLSILDWEFKTGMSYATVRKAIKDERSPEEALRKRVVRKNKKFLFHIHEALYERLNEMAKRRHISMSFYIINALFRQLNEDSKFDK